jgi:hypothetical protein
LIELSVERLGARGDGIAEHGGEAVFLPFTMRGDRVRARLVVLTDRPWPLFDRKPQRAHGVPPFPPSAAAGPAASDAVAIARAAGLRMRVMSRIRHAAIVP